ncbi:MAG: hypothetical protein FWG34_12045, partial [Oscillospiraceae bacterium]|nr:hypothetical protein [Oscillospiraceae bacterium]
MKKHFCFVVAFLIVFSCLAASCDTGGPETGEKAPGETAPEKESTDPRHAVKEELPEETYGGKSINVLMGHFAYKDMYAET